MKLENIWFKKAEKFRKENERLKAENKKLKKELDSKEKEKPPSETALKEAMEEYKRLTSETREELGKVKDLRKKLASALSSCKSDIKELYKNM